ncbi:MAG TPA: nuclear transport factor 2 family protein [Holophagaceae bacterium]|nr:nuclear transport factor 2 family protein [Holophagaceae bacterium]
MRLLMSGFLLTLPALAQAPPRTAEAVAAAERAFAARAAQVGTPAAFLATLTPDSVVFTPAAENGPAAQRAKPEDGSRLAWEPEYVELAASGDFALSTGPWAWRPKAEAEPVVHGHYLSLWVIRDGGWRVLLDVGAPHPLQAPQALTLRALPSAPDPAARVKLGEAWKAFDAQAAVDLHGALHQAGSTDFRAYRRGVAVRAGVIPPPTAGFMPALWREAGWQIAASEDLALRWGLREGKGPDRSTVQVWRREAGAWKLAMDVELPLPGAKP